MRQPNHLCHARDEILAFVQVAGWFIPVPVSRRRKMAEGLYARNRTLRKSLITRISSETGLYQRLRRIRRCSGEVASRAFWQMTRFGLRGFPDLAKPVPGPVRTRRSALHFLIPL